MQIEWKIEKKRGNFRPDLSWQICLDAYERGLALGVVKVETTIPRPPEDWAGFCYPGCHERASDWQPDRYHVLSTPCHKNTKLIESARLPWRQDNQYPEVEKGFSLLRSAFEQALQAAYDSLPLAHTAHMASSDTARQHIAAGWAAQRFLRAVGQ